VLGEAAASWLMARRPVRTLLEQPETDCTFGRSLTMKSIGRFYTPMALMSFLALAIHPITTFFMGRSRQPLESLAVVPVIAALVFLFRTPGIAYHEVVIALLGDRLENHSALKRFSVILGGLSTAALTIVAFSPLVRIWLQDISGLSPDLARFALVPIRILVVLPATEVFVSLLRGLLVKTGRTWPLVAGVTGQIIAVLGTLWITVGSLNLIGATAAGVSQLVGYAAGLLILIGAARRAARECLPNSEGGEAVKNPLSCP
jgi:hypothetical protein